MPTAPHSDTRHATGPDHDGGLDHPHDWARERTGVRRHGPLVADAARVPTPSSALHDDALYA